MTQMNSSQRVTRAIVPTLVTGHAPSRQRATTWLVALGTILVLQASATCLTAAGCVAPPAGLAGWWPGDGNANDISGTNHGALLGGATATNAGKVAQTFRFDGTNGYVQIPDSPVLKPTNLTVEAWVRFDSLNSSGSGAPQGDQYLVFKQNTRTTGFAGYSLIKTRVTAGDVFEFVVASASGQRAVLPASTLVQTGVWYHVAAVRGTNFTEIYVNGQREAQMSVSFPQDYGTRPLFLGSSGQTSWDRKLNGKLDEVSLYNRALSSSEIAAIYAAGSAGKCKSDTIPPSITCPPPVTGNANLGQCYATGVALGTPTTSDNVGVAQVTNNAPVQFPVGATTVTWTVFDTSGNSNTCAQVVTVLDRQAPTAVCKNATVQLNANGQGAITAADVNNGSSDNCGIASLSVSPSTFTFCDVGNRTVTLTVIDVHSNSATCTATVTVLAPAAPLVVYVDATYPVACGAVTFPNSGGSGTYYIGYNAFKTIPGAVNAVAAGGTVRVAAGTYGPAQTVIGKPLTLQGTALESTIIDGGGAIQTSRGLLRVQSVLSNSVAISGFTFQNGGLYDTGSGVVADLVVLDSVAGDVSVQACKFIGRGGVGTSISHGVYVGGTGNGNVQVRNNFFSGFNGASDFAVYEDTLEGAMVVANNSLVDARVGTSSADAPLVDASGNWWGSHQPATVRSKVTTFVDFTPWLDAGTDSSAAAGFQGDFGTLWADSYSLQPDGVLYLQEAHDLASGASPKVIVAAGDYFEDLIISKAGFQLVAELNQGVDARGVRNAESYLEGTDPAGTIQIAGADDVVLDGLYLGIPALGIGVTAPAANVTVRNLIVEDSDSDAINLAAATSATVVSNYVWYAQWGIGIAVGSGSTPATASIRDNLVEGAVYGITGNLSGSSITGNVVDSMFAFSGPAVGIGGQWANTTVADNYVGFYGDMSDPLVELGIGLTSSSGVTISGNTLDTCDTGIYVDSTSRVGISIQDNNLASDSTYYGLAVAGSATVKNNAASFTANDVGVYVTGTGRALLENNNLSGNFTAGLLVEGTAVVDAGDCTGGNVTGLGTGSGLNGSSAGGNDLSGYLGTGTYAILNSSSQPVLAYQNNFGAVAGDNIHEVVSGLVSFSQSGGLLVTCPPPVSGLPSLGDVPAPATSLAQFLAAGGLASASPATVGSSDATVTNAPGDYTITRTYLVTDACGQSASCQQVFTVTSSSAPLVTYVDRQYDGLPAGTAVTWPASGGTGTHYIGGDAFASIQGGVDAVVAGGAVRVAAGTYGPAQTVISKPITLQGAALESTIIDGGGATQSSRGLVRVQGVSSNSVAISGFTFENGGLFDAGSGVVADLVVLDSVAGDVSVQACKFIGRGGVGTSISHGVYVGGTGNGNVQVRNNFFSGFNGASDFAVYENTLDGAVVVFNNSLVDSRVGASSADAPLVDASGNWWGSHQPATVRSKVTTFVDFTPWLEAGTDSSAAAGFQGDFGTLWADSYSLQPDGVLYLQEAHDLASGASPKVIVAAGDYFEDLIISKAGFQLVAELNQGVDARGARNAESYLEGTDPAGTIQIAGADHVVLDGLYLGIPALGIGVTAPAANVTVRNLIVEDSDSDAINLALATSATVVSNYVWYAQWGIGIAVGSGSAPATASIRDNLVEGAVNGITGNLSGSTITGNVVDSMFAFSGPAVGIGGQLANTTVANNYVGFYGDGGDPLVEVGIGLTSSSGVTISGNTLDTCDTGIYVDSTSRVGISIQDNNLASDSTYYGLAVAGSATVKNNAASFTANDVGVYVAGTGRALLENNNLSGNFTAGLLVEGTAVVDAGDCTGGNVTGLGTGSGLNGSSAGGNDLSGYLGTGTYAILNSSSQPVLAYQDNFGAVAGDNILEVVSGLVSFSQSGGLLVSCPPPVSGLQCLGEEPAAATSLAQFLAAGGLVSASPATVNSSDATVTNAPGNFTITRTYLVTDACGQSASCQQVITVISSSAPLVTYVDRQYDGLPAGTAVSWPASGGTGPHYIGCDAFATIQHGMDRVAPNGTVNVAGTFNLAQVVVTKPMTLLGIDPDTAIIHSEGDDNVRPSRGLVRVQDVTAGSTVTISGFTFHHGGLFDTGSGVVADLVVLDSVAADVSVQACQLIGRGGVGASISHGVYVGGTGNGNVQVRNNFFSGFNGASDFAVYEDTLEGAVVVANNSLVDARVGTSSADAPLVDASGNWWGSHQPATVRSKVTTFVDFTPWLDAGTDSSAAAGFQGDFGTLWADSYSLQPDGVLYLQEAHDLASGASPKVIVAAGDYFEDLIIGKAGFQLVAELNQGVDARATRNAESYLEGTDPAGTIQIAGADDVVLDGLYLGIPALGIGVTAPAANVTVRNLIVEDSDSDAINLALATSATVVSNYVWYAQWGIGIAVGSGSAPATASIRDNLVEGAVNGISGNLSGSSITGNVVDSLFAFEGPALGIGGQLANTTVADNYVGFYGDGSDPLVEVGIGLTSSSGVTISGNTLDTCDTGIYVDSNSKVGISIQDNNVASDSTYYGLAIAGSATVKNNAASFTANDVGVYVTGTGRALLENNNLSGNFTAGLLVEGTAVVDAGDCTGGNVTGLGTGSGLNGSSAGGNDLSGYLGTGAYAIMNSSSQPVLAYQNNFGAAAGDNILEVVSGLVSFSQSGGLLVSCPPPVSGLPSLGDVPAPVVNLAQFLIAGGMVSANPATVSSSDATVTNAPDNFTITRTYLVTDACGQSASCQQLFIVRAATPPTLSLMKYSSGVASVYPDGAPGSSYAVLASTNLTDWVSLETNTAPFTCVHTNADALSRCFYRGLLVP